MISIWTSIIDKTHRALSENGVNGIEFKSIKNDDSYVKANAGVPCTNWVFASRADTVWVELEIKPRTSKGQRVPQQDLYDTLKQHRSQVEEKCGFEITWDEEDRVSGLRKADGGDFRIKSYIRPSNGSIEICADELVSRMVKFILAFTASSGND